MKQPKQLKIGAREEIRDSYMSANITIYGSTVLGRCFSFLILYAVGRTPWTGDQPVARPLPTHRTTQEQNNRTQTSVP
jgi:hypothetical protein